MGEEVTNHVFGCKATFYQKRWGYKIVVNNPEIKVLQLKCVCATAEISEENQGTRTTAEPKKENQTSCY